MKKKKYDFDINNKSHHRHPYLFIMPLPLFRQVKSISDGRQVSLRSVLIDLIRKGLKASELEGD